MHPRNQGRAFDALREISIEPNYLKHPWGSAMIRCGDTWVLCSASVEERVPSFLLGQNQGWVTAEYSMLPGSGTSRISRGSNGRSKEIERLIGRSLRAAVDMKLLGTRTISIDCDVIQADAGTRTAAITGGCVALALALQTCLDKKLLLRNPLQRMVAAVSVGLVQGTPLLDLEYQEDVQADVDMNIVMAEEKDVLRYVEIQGTGEKATFDQSQFLALCALANLGIEQLISYQKQAMQLGGVKNIP